MPWSALKATRPWNTCQNHIIRGCFTPPLPMKVKLWMKSACASRPLPCIPHACWTLLGHAVQTCSNVTSSWLKYSGCIPLDICCTPQYKQVLTKPSLFINLDAFHWPPTVDAVSFTAYILLSNFLISFSLLWSSLKVTWCDACQIPINYGSSKEPLSANLTS